MKHVVTVLFTLFIVIQLFYPTAIAQGSDLEYLSYIYVPSVIDEEEGKGSIIRIGLYVTKSNTTDIVVEGPEYIGEDTLYAAKLALVVVDKIIGIKQGYTYHIVIETRGKITGPSAGAAFAVLLMSAILGDEIKHNLSMTGALSGDGGVEGVAGLVIKANATKQYGLTEIVAPYNIFSPSIHSKIRKLNITIKPVANILEAYYEATGRRITTSTMPKVPLPIGEKFQEYAYKVISYVKSSIKNIIDEAVRVGLEFWVINSTRSFVEDRIVKALQALSKGDFYSAASLAFTAYVNLSSLKIYADLLSGRISVNEEVRRLTNRLNKLNTTLINTRYSCLGEFEVIAAAWYRFYEAYRSLKAIRTTRTLLDKARLIAYIDARISTAEYWYDLRRYACLVNPVEINDALAKKIAEYAYDYAKLAYKYVRSIVVETTGSEKGAQGLDEAFNELKQVAKLGVPELTYAYAAELASRIYSPLKIDITLTKLLNRTIIEKVLEGYRETVALYNERLTSRNIRLIVATAYLEYSRWVNDPYVAAQMIAMADSYLTPILLAYSNTTISLGEVSLPITSVSPAMSLTTYYYIIMTMGIGMGLAFVIGLYLGSKMALPRDIERIKEFS